LQLGNGANKMFYSAIIAQKERKVNMAHTAIEKIKAEFKEAKLTNKGKAVGPSVLDALISFCEQNSEFAQAVTQNDKTVGECIENTVKGSGSSISDIEVYRKAVEFYFSGATVRFNMVIDLGDGGFSNSPATHAEGKPTQVTSLQLSLDDLLM